MTSCPSSEVNLEACRCPTWTARRWQPARMAPSTQWRGVALPILMIVITIATLLVINQKKQWLTVPCYRTPTKQPTCLNNQLVYVDCQKGMKVQVDSSQRMLRIADPDSRYSGYYSMQKQSNLQADNFYQTV
ncbi:hypothetical protein SKAU_G00342010 [Synaphobranchus kaupii]|uniref:Cysteine-rich motor neuron 1 protein C-terminal domain-containing protein n=1 Tax=Synaphobranchus kaupii TaxID=118154 RepID=A0A9Q1IIL9_SYNKA|nr:hypothetical protein SKAU_G00342010 [Synaphobranchus kaupii]